MDPPEHESATQGSNAQFPRTSWTQIVAARGITSTEARDALNDLCSNYWPPVYAFLRRKGIDTHKAKDLTQAFFVHLLEIDFPTVADLGKGRFRSFMLAVLNNFLKDDWRHRQAQKRGGAVQFVYIDESDAEERYDKLPQQEPEPTRIYDRAWAALVIERTKAKLKESFVRRGRLAVYEALAPFLAREPNPAKYAELADELKMTRANVQVNLTRLNDAFGGHLRQEIAKTVANSADTDNEILYLLSAWSAEADSEESKRGIL